MILKKLSILSYLFLNELNSSQEILCNILLSINVFTISFINAAINFKNALNYIFFCLSASQQESFKLLRSAVLYLHS